MQTIVLINGRFEPLNSPDRIEVFDVRNLARGDDGRVIPLFHVPQIVGLSSRVRNWNPEPWGDWRLADVWLELRRP
jgi:MarR-like DNA-binding transcriptional regulator SgrR of sgrS sRNA